MTIRNLFFILLYITQIRVFAQNLSIKTIKGGVIIKNNIENIYGFTFKNYDSDTEYMFAVKPNYATQVFTCDSILLLNKTNYIVNILPLDTIDNSVVTKKIAFNGFFDSYRLIKIHETPSNLTNIKSLQYNNIIRDRLNDFHFNIRLVDDIFEQKKIKADYILKGEILNCKLVSNGVIGVSITIVIKWNFYTTTSDKVVWSFITGGYSNSKNKISEHEVLKSAIKDAIGGFTVNKELITFLTNNNIHINKAPKGFYGLNYFNNKSLNNNYEENVQLSYVKIISNSKTNNGFLLDSEGHILTTYDAILDSLNTYAQFENGLELPIKIVSFDKNINMALCKILGKGYYSLNIDTTTYQQIGNEVIAIYKSNQNIPPKIIKGSITDIKDQNIETNAFQLSQNNLDLLLNKNGNLIAVILNNNEKKIIPINDILRFLKIILIY